jgi:hypothetical protein
MARAFNLDPTAAREANTGGKRITETGKYIGTLLAAFYEKNQNGTESVNFMFESDQKQEAGPLVLYTHNSAGEALHGNKVLNALMVCVRQKSLSVKPGTVQLYDYDANAVVAKQKETYPELTGKKIGLVLRKEEYHNGQGELRYRILIEAPFEAETELMAAEILDKSAQPKALAKFMEHIMANPVRKAKQQRQPANNSSAQSFQAPATDYDDDFPF